MHHSTDRITHTTAFVTPAQWVHPRKDQSDDPSHHERTLLPRSYISLRYVMIQIILLHGFDVCISIVRLSSSLNETFLSLSLFLMSVPLQSGHHHRWRFQRRRRLRGQQRLGADLATQRPALCLAHRRHGRHHRGQHRLQLRQVNRRCCCCCC